MKQILLSFCTLYHFAQSQSIPITPQVPANPLPAVVDPLPNHIPGAPIVDPLPQVSANPLPSLPAVVDPLPNPIPGAPIVEPLPLPQPPATIPTVLTPPQPEQATGAFGQVCNVHSTSRCQAPPISILTSTSTPGFIECHNDFDCCLCAAIECHDCISFVSGNSGVYGVGAIIINGRDAQSGGAEINCEGVESCSTSVITATNIKSMSVSGDMGSKNAVVTITNPTPDFKLECTGVASCEGLKLEIIIPAPVPGTFCSYEPLSIQGFLCSAPESCKNMDITIRNEGCNKLLIENFECTELDACIEANFNFVGDIDIVNCNLGPSGHTATGISKCYQNLQALLCQDPGSCRGIVKTITNPSTGFSLQCGSLGSCQGAQLTLHFNPSPWLDPVTGNAFREPTSWIDGFKFSGEASGAMATIYIRNDQKGHTLEIGNIECSAFNACAYTTFIIGKDVEVVNLLCLEGTCDGCLVKVAPNDPGIACAQYRI